MMIKSGAFKGKLFNLFVSIVLMGLIALPSYSFAEMANASTLNFGDIDGNGELDLIISKQDKGIWVYKNNSLWDQIKTDGAETVITGDLNGDNKEEIIANFGVSAGLKIYKNESDWESLEGKGTATERMTTGDLDANNKDELVTDFGTGNGIWVYQNNSVWESVDENALTAENIVTGDIDGNGKADLLVVFEGEKGLWALMNNGSWEQLDNSLNVDQMATGDLDGNGKDEVIISSAGNLELWVYKNHLTLEQLDSNALTIEDLATGDLDGNGKDEIIVNSGGDLGLWAYENNNAWDKLNDTTMNIDDLAIGDMDGNGKDDLVVKLKNGSELWAYKNDSNWEKLDPDGLVSDDGDTVKQWDIHEISLTTSNSYTKVQKYSEVTLEATFTGPNGKTYTVPGFWDGGDTWKIRFAPVAPGTWNYTIFSSDSQLNSTSHDGSFTAIKVSESDKRKNPNYRGFLKLGGDARHFTYEDGTPYFWLGDTWWFGDTAVMGFEKNPNDPHPNIAEFPFLVNDRRAKGFTAIQIAIDAVIGFTDDGATDSKKPGVNEGGFVFSKSYTEINPEHFKWLDKRIKLIVDSGMVPVIFGQWGNVTKEWSDQTAFNYWKYIIARYTAYNVIWSVSGEFHFGNVDRVGRMGEYVHDNDPMGHLTSAHPGPFGGSKNSSGYTFHNESWLDFNMNHTWTQEDRPVLIDDYKRTPKKPVVSIEAGYDGMWYHYRDRVREEAWTLLISGAAGYTYGKTGVFWWRNSGDSNWYDNYDAPSSHDMKHIVNFFSELEWEKMYPRDDLATRGYVRAENGRQYAVYLINGGNTTVSNLPAVYTAKWYDPREGTWLDATGGPSFTAPDTQDWVLYIREGDFDVTRDGTGTNENPELIGHWALDRGTGISALDSSSNNNEGILRNDATWTAGKLDKAVRFDGVNDYIEIPHTSDYLLDQGTVSFWFKAGNVTEAQGLFSKDSSGFDTGGHITVFIDTDSKIKARIQSTANTVTLTSSEISAGIWYHVAFSFGDGGAELSVNGGTPVVNTYDGGLGSTSGGSGNLEPIVLGAANWLSDDKSASPIQAPFSGIMDDVRFYNKKLSDSEIDDLANGNEPAPSDDSSSDDNGNGGSSLPDEVAPFLESVQVEGSEFVLTWSQPLANSGIPSGGYDIVIDDEDTNSLYRTTSLTTRIEGLTQGVKHCFVIQGRWTQKSPTVFNLSNKLCGTISENSSSNALMVGHWEFEEGSGSSASDSSATDNKGSLRNYPTWSTTGKIGNALLFDGQNDYVKISHNDAYLLAEGTVSFWFLAKNITLMQTLFSKDSSGYDTGGHLSIYIDSDAKVKVRMQSDSVSHFLESDKITAYTWYLVTLKYGKGGMELTLNGGAPVTASYEGGLGTTSGGEGNFEPIVVGASSKLSGDKQEGPVDEYFYGKIDDLRLYNKKLSGTEIALLLAGEEIPASDDPSPEDPPADDTPPVEDDTPSDDNGSNDSTLPDEVAPILESAKVDGSDFVLTWSQPQANSGIPSGGYDIVIDDEDTNSLYRTTSLTARINGLTQGVKHCFVIQGRWTQKSPTVFNLSNKLCGTISETITPELGILSHWNFNDGDGHTASDSSGNSDGALRPNSPVWTDGKLGQALRFDGEEDYVEIPHSNAFLLDQGSVSFWFKADDVTLEQGLFSKDSSGFDAGGHLTIYIDTDSKVKARMQSVSSSYTLSSAEIQPDTWYHVVFSFGDGGMELFLNGGAPVTNTYTGGWGTTSGGAGNYEPIVVGAASWLSDNQSATPILAPFKGIIDELSLFDKKLTDSEIAKLVEHEDDPSSDDPPADDTPPEENDTSSDDNGSNDTTLPDEVAPVLESVQAEGNVFLLTWSQPQANSGVPKGGYDILINDVDTNNRYRTTSLTTRITGLRKDVKHCFAIQARWTQKNPTVFNLSNKLCGTITETEQTETEQTETLTVGHWKFEEGSGTSALDSSATDNKGSLRNYPTWSTFGKIGNALLFDGQNDYVKISHNDAYLLAEGTVSFWFLAKNITYMQTLFSKDSSGYDTGGHLSIYIDSDSKVKVRLQSDTVSHFLASERITHNTWYLLTFKYGKDGMELSLNGGTPVTTSYEGGLGTTSGSAGNFEPIVVGASSKLSGDKQEGPVDEYFYGKIDDLRLYNRKISDSEVNALMDAANNL